MHARARTTLALPLVAVAVAVAGCGGDDPSSDATAATESAAVDGTDDGAGTSEDAGDEADEGDPGADAVEVVRAFIRAGVTNDADTACGLLTEDGERSFVAPMEELQQGLTCADVITFIAEASEGEDPVFEVSDEEIPLSELDTWPFDAELSADGSAATVTSQGTEAIELRLEDDGWRIDLFVQ